jgi:hypothetical protein
MKPMPAAAGISRTTLAFADPDLDRRWLER